MPLPSYFEAACSQGRTAPYVTLRGTMCPLRALALKPQELHAQPMPFRLGKYFEVAILLRVYQGHHRHTAQCRPGGGEALRLERIKERGEAKVRQELALEGVARGGEPVPVAQPHEGREVHLAGNVLLPDVLVWVTTDDVSMVANQRTLVILERVEISGQLTVVDRENKPAVEGLGKLARPVLHGQVHLASIPFGKGRGAVKLAPLRPRSGGERGAVKLVPLRPRRRGEQA